MAKKRSLAALESANLTTDAQKWHYRGDGQGVPGIPHVISREEAERLGMLDLLDAAIAAGVYVAAGEAGQESALESAN
jgi:hypothetical protein